MSENKKQPQGDRAKPAFRAGEESYREPIKRDREPSTDETYREPRPQTPTQEGNQK